MHALLKHTLSNRANLELHNHSGHTISNTLAKELFLLRLCIVLCRSQQLLADLDLVIPPSLIPTDLNQIFVRMRSELKDHRMRK